MSQYKLFPGKVLLFGEYTLLYNQRSLAIPFDKYAGSWSFDPIEKKVPTLDSWALWLAGQSGQENWLTKKAIESFREDIAQGLWFDANIPQGYGLGSSGALVAAWYDKYIAIDEVSDKRILQSRFAFLESFFHGTSSGFDPLISYLQRPILLDKEDIKEIPAASRLPLLEQCFILDTGIPRSTEPLVKLFKEKAKEVGFKNEILPRLIAAQSNAMDAFILGEAQTLKQEFFNISQIQFDHLSELIPDNLNHLWQEGLREQSFLLKLCGAGGGGCMLGWGNPPDANFPIIPLSN